MRVRRVAVAAAIAASAASAWINSNNYACEMFPNK